MSRTCKFCGNPLPEGCAGQRRYHDYCAKAAHKKLVSEYQKVMRPRRRKKKDAPMHGPHYDPMKGLGMDYVALKLAGQIRPRSRKRQQITLHDF
jgi:hypothetical protein